MTPLRFNIMRALVYGELFLRGYRIKEGSSSPQELDFLYATAQEAHIHQVAEIGFHLGFSAYAFLKANPTLKVTSFDIASHPFIFAAKKIIERKFPGRHRRCFFKR